MPTGIKSKYLDRRSLSIGLNRVHPNNDDGATPTPSFFLREYEFPLLRVHHPLAFLLFIDWGADLPIYRRMTNPESRETSDVRCDALYKAIFLMVNDHATNAEIAEMLRPESPEIVSRVLMRLSPDVREAVERLL